MTRLKTTFTDAGSTVFAKNLLTTIITVVMHGLSNDSVKLGGELLGGSLRLNYLSEVNLIVPMLMSVLCFSFFPKAGWGSPVTQRVGCHPSTACALQHTCAVNRPKGCTRVRLKLALVSRITVELSRPGG